MKKAISLCLVLTMFGAMMSACAGSAGGGTASQTDAQGQSGSQAGSSAQQSAEDVIRIGAITAVTGDKAEMGESFWRSWELAIEKVNENGGVLGKQVELVLEDSKGDPKEAVELTKKWAMMKAFVLF